MSAIKCLAGVSYNSNEPIRVEEITVDPPKAHEVRVKIMYTGICHTDAFTLGGNDSEERFPCVLGHEGAGIVESIGEGVTNVKVGDHVIPLFTPDCGECELCKSGKTNLCSSVRETQGKGVMPDGTTRFHNSKGEPIYHYMGCSTFSQYTVLADVSVVAIQKEAALSSVCLLGCGVTTGYGSAVITAGVEEGSSVGVWGAGTVGLSVVQGAKANKAKTIFVVDTDNKKKDWAMQFGATKFINPKDYDKPIQDVIVEMTNGGLDYTFDCTGNVDVMRQALEASHKGWGKSVVIGLASKGKMLSARPYFLVTGRVWTGAAYGGVKGRHQLPDIVQRYLDGKLMVDEYITNRRPLKDINSGFDDLSKGACLRTVLDMWN